MADDKTSGEVEHDARMALLEAALKAAKYLDSIFTPIGEQNLSSSRDTANLEGSKNYYNNVNPERADIALRLLEIAFPTK